MSNAEPGQMVSVFCNTDAIDSTNNSVFLPTMEQLSLWANKAARTFSRAGKNEDALELSVALVDENTIRELNKQYRKIDKSTNVLSFTALEDLLDPNLTVTGLLGDVVLCPAVIQREAAEQGKPVENHFAHLLIHGVLHLNGMDHHAESDAQAMEAAEIQILSSLDIPDPYNLVPKQTI